MVRLLCTSLLMIQGLALAQQEPAFTGAVASTKRNSLVVRSDSGECRLFVFDQFTVKPSTLPVDSEVQVISRPSEEPGVRIAEQITMLSTPAPPLSQGRQRSVQPQSSEPVPPQIRSLEREIERQARRYQVGFRSGLALDPETLLVGGHAQIGPFFNSDIFFRPNVEFGWGEVTKLIGINLEGIYRLPLTSRHARWSTYFGGGPAITFLHQNFERPEAGIDIDFGDFVTDVGLNLLGGVRYRNGMFVELRASVYSAPAPTMRLMLGYNF